MVKQQPVSGFGLKLREARERRGTSLRQIANTTKISVVALEALERNDISKLPGGIFSRAFVRAYALEVGLEPEEAIREFIAQFPQDSVTAGHPPSTKIEDELTTDINGRPPSAYLPWLLVGVPVALVLIYLASTALPRTVASVSVPLPTVAAPAGVVADVVPAAPTLEADTDAVATAGGVLPTAVNEPLIAPDIQPASQFAADSALVVELVATGSTRVVATVDGEPVINRTLRPGDRRSLEARRTLVLTMSDPAAIGVTLNGAEARPFGKAGERTTTTLTPENFRQYLMTH